MQKMKSIREALNRRPAVWAGAEKNLDNMQMTI